MAFNWHLIGIITELFCDYSWNKCKRTVHFVVLCVIREVHGDILIVGDGVKDMRTERNVFFFGDFNVTTPQRRSSPHTHTHTH